MQLEILIKNLFLFLFHQPIKDGGGKEQEKILYFPTTFIRPGIFFIV